MVTFGGVLVLGSLCLPACVCECECAPAIATILAPARQDSSLFEVVVEFNQDVPDFSASFVKVFCGSKWCPTPHVQCL